MVLDTISTEMNSENMISIRNSFSIENILSKPSKNQLIENQCKSDCGTECSENNNTSDEVSTITGDELILKKEPNNGLVHEDHLMTNNDFTNINRSQFTSPDSSGCEEENGGNLSDTTTGDNCKLISFRSFLFIL